MASKPSGRARADGSEEEPRGKLGCVRVSLGKMPENEVKMPENEVKKRPTTHGVRNGCGGGGR